MPNHTNRRLPDLLRDDAFDVDPKGEFGRRLEAAADAIERLETELSDAKEALDDLAGITQAIGEKFESAVEKLKDEAREEGSTGALGAAERLRQDLDVILGDLNG